jgi:HAD superfamily hydrolase (TIGR01509 family)
MTNQQGIRFVRDFDPAPITTLLLDADDNLFASEAPAFVASTEVTNRFLARFGVASPFTAEELRKQAVGKNFRNTAILLAIQSGVPFERTLAEGHPDAVVASDHDVVTGRALTAKELERWVREEREQVTAYLGATLKPNTEVHAALDKLASRYALAVVSSSASKRLDASFAATGLDSLVPAAVRFSAEDSLPVPTSKPDPAVYLHAGQVLDVAAHQGLAVEDSVPGVKSAVAAGYLTVGNVMFVPAEERRSRTEELIDAGAAAITESWHALEDALMLSAVTGGGSPA